VRLNRKLFLSISGGVVLIGSLTLWWNRVPEPKLNDVGLGYYLENAAKQADVASIVPQFGLAAVPYLANQIEPDPIRELLSSASQKLKFEPAALQKDRADYQQRRKRALTFLYLLGPDAVEAALPAILSVAERPEDPAFQSVLPLLRLALGTEHETRALHAVIGMTKLKRQHWSHTFAKQLAYEMLPKFKNHPEIIMPVLIESLQEPGGYKRIEVVVAFGTNAIPALQEATRSETNHVRTATVVWSEFSPPQLSPSRRQTLNKRAMHPQLEFAFRL
jgi:hypothetical protein